MIKLQETKSAVTVVKPQ